MNKEMVYILTQTVTERYNKKFYNLGAYRNLDLANRQLSNSIEHDIDNNNVELNNRDELSASLSNDWVTVFYKIDAQFLE